MNKFRILFYTVLGVLMSAAPALAQAAEAAADNASSVAKYGKIAAGIGFAIAAGLGALGQGRVASAAAEGAARNPGASGRIQILMIIGLAFIETLVIFTLVIMFAIVAYTPVQFALYLKAGMRCSGGACPPYLSVARAVRRWSPICKWKAVSFKRLARALLHTV